MSLSMFVGQAIYELRNTYLSSSNKLIPLTTLMMNCVNVYTNRPTGYLMVDNSNPSGRLDYNYSLQVFEPTIVTKL